MARLPAAGVVAFIDKVRHKLGRLGQKLAPPPVAALDFVTGMWNFQIVYTLCEFGVFDKLSNNPTDASSIASQLSLPEERIYRVLRAASNIGVVSETQGKKFTIAPIGLALRSDTLGSMRDFILFQGRIGWTSWSRLKDTVATDKNAINLLYNKSTFDFFSTPEVSDVFNKAMNGISGMSVDAFLAAFSPKDVKTVADVGGGQGRLLGSVLKAHPELSGVLLDLPAVVAGAGSVLQELGVQSRCRVLGADFFEPLPEFEADVILMKNIIHDWSDSDSIRILRHVGERMKSGTRLVLYEVVVPGPKEPSFAKYLDIEMLVHAEGKERTKEEYAALFSAAGLELSGVTRTPGPWSLVEATLP